MSTSPQTVLITGANRGIGLELAKLYHARGDKVIAAIRDVSKAPTLEGIITVKIDSASLTDPKEAAEKLKAEHGIDHLDVVIANAAIANHYALVRDIDATAFDEHHFINARGPLVLFQGLYPLLKDNAKFIIISTLPSANGCEHFSGMTAYASSKATINFISRSIHFEEPNLISLQISPGWVDTDMGNAGAKASGLDAPPEKMSDTVPQIVKVIDNATREETSGYMWNYDGTKVDF